MALLKKKRDQLLIEDTPGGGVFRTLLTFQGDIYKSCHKCGSMFSGEKFKEGLFFCETNGSLWCKNCTVNERWPCGFFDEHVHEKISAIRVEVD